LRKTIFTAMKNMDWIAIFLREEDMELPIGVIQSK
jgi:hypothetical protein